MKLICVCDTNESEEVRNTFFKGEGNKAVTGITVIIIMLLYFTDGEHLKYFFK